MFLKVKIFNYFYYNNIDKENEEFNAPVLCIKCRDEEKRNHLIQILDKENLTPRFGVLQENLEKILLFNPQLNYEVAPNSLYGEEVYNIFTDFPWQVGQLKKGIDQTFGADIKWEKKAMSIIIKKQNLTSTYIEIPDDYIYRFLKVEDIKPLAENEHFLIEGRNCYWDIETDSRDMPSGRLKYSDFTTMPIVSITSLDNYEKEYHQFVWHPNIKEEITKKIYDFEIPDNILNDKILTIDKNIRHEYLSEKSMLNGFFEYFSQKKFDYMFGYFSVGGWSKQGKKKMWVDGFDSLCLYARAKSLGLLEEIQLMSSCPQMYGYKGRYEAVYMRSSGGKHELVIKGVAQIDFVFSEKILAFAQKYYKFRGHKLSDWARFFLDYNKLDKDEHQVYHYWDQSDIREVDHLLGNIENGLLRVKNKGIEFMLDYNLIDVKICVDLDEFFKVTVKQVGRTEVSISPADDGLTASKLHDHFKLTHYQDLYSFDTKYQKFKRPEINGKDQIGNKFTITLEILQEKARARGVRVPLIGTNGIPTETMIMVTYNSLKDIGKAGGFVPTPIGRGIYENIAVIDASKFYPNMIKSTNAGIVSAIDLYKEYWFCVVDKRGNFYDRKDIIETPISFFRKDVKSLNALLFDTWMVKRIEAQAKLKEYMKEHHTTKTDKYKMLWTEQFNIKNFMNAGFGVLGLPVDRTYSKLCFNSCTISCQDVLMFCINLVEGMGITLIGGDTDSMFIQLKSRGVENNIIEAEGYCDYLNRKIDDYLDKVYNIQEHTISIGLETVSPKFFVDTMKHYIKLNTYAEGVILDEPELEIKGMDLKKRATSVIGTELQEKLIDVIFESTDEDGDSGIVLSTEDAIRIYIVNFDRKLERRSWVDVCKRGPLNKSLDKYPDSNQSATAARNTLKYLGRYYGPGSNPFLGVFSNYPEHLNGKFLNGDKDFVLSFDKEDEVELKKFGFKLNYERIRETECHKKTEHLLSIFGTNYYNIVESAEIGDSLLI